ncbi:DUF190 domain-containing protein [Acidithiobacillus caldus ATCC 51756]|uniref:DUF190 domain-containing protein n=1 Tax=Acidithiobacillus caldus TaxID=33059 RepID=UPI00058A06E6|nr:DUF190 domain-containing protein [Acidithiobacillus caldus]MBU2729922.1 DUF190 domain-containing protein [Acidithiobacillus caldus]MBU2734973.1 DUF190 domain-containing protein [Acidithiobacillus caldus ATCC 51756]MBU2745864.1 DUF190 domain-containing protein [Acidithiobacillus caldus]MBU2781423.1 DUF190 domain-containing protein [Acidithiobacillus caldus]
MRTISVVRFYMREGDKQDGQILMKEIFRMMHDHYRLLGVTAFRGIAGFGSRGTVHADDILRLNIHLPLVLEFFDEPAAIDSIIPQLEQIVAGNHIIRWEAQCG